MVVAGAPNNGKSVSRRGGPSAAAVVGVVGDATIEGEAVAGPVCESVIANSPRTNKVAG